MGINIKKLNAELLKSGILFGGLNADGIVWDIDGYTEIQSRPDVQLVLAAHNPDTPAWDDIRKERDVLLAMYDWTQLADVALTIEEKAAWSDYRQALRDLPQMFESPEDVVFPTSPNGGA